MIIRRFGAHKAIGNGPVSIILPIDNGMKVCIPAAKIGEAALWVEITDAELAILNEWRLQHPGQSLK
jgi:hypothetical protein